MKKSKKAILMIVMALIICGCGAGITYKIYGNGEKDITEMFFDPDSREYVKNMTVYNNEMIEMDGYKVALETSLYDSEVGIGYFVFSIQQTDGGTDYLDEFFKKYHFEEYSAGSIQTEVITEGNTTYYYLGLEITLWPSDKFKDKVYLKERESSAELYVFDLISVSNNQKYEYNGKQVVLSPIGLRVNREQFIEPDIVILKYNDGTKDKTIVKDGRLQEKNNENLSHMGGGDGKYAFICNFKNIMDITNVESIVVDGNEYKLVTE